MKMGGRALLLIAFAAAAVGCQLLKSQSTGEDASATAPSAATATPSATAADTATSTATPTGTTTAAVTAKTTATAAPNKPAASGSASPSASASAAPSGGACDSIAGTWSTRGTCGPDTCKITQTGCTTNFSCSDGNASYTGQITGKTVSYAGITAAKTKGSCTGTIGADGKSINGTCQSGGAPCTFTATKR